MNKADEAFKEYNKGLAENLFIAYLAHFHGVTFQTAQKYAKQETEIGAFWLDLADVVTEVMQKRINDSVLETDKVIELDQVD